MPVTELLMKPGTWDLQLLPETPKAIRDVLQLFGHIVILEARPDQRVMADVDLLANALYVGPLRHKATPFQLAGTGMAIWLGDEEGKGPLVNGTTTNTTFVNTVNGIMNIVPAPVTLGSITAVGAGIVTNTFTNVSQRVALDWVMQFFTGQHGTADPAEYRVNNNGTLDAGLSSALFVTTPKVVAMPHEGGRETSGLAGIEPTDFSLETDADSYTTKLLLVGSAGNATANLAPATTYKDIHGNLVQLTRLVTSTQTAAGQEAAMAAAQLALYPLRQVPTLSTDRYDVPHDVRAGDWIYVYDPEQDLLDTTNAQNYRGQVIWPVKLRVYGITWPVEPGMAVYYRPGNAAVGADYTDLTPYIAFETPRTTFQLGAAARGYTVS